jgi:hypothetical protein
MSTFKEFRQRSAELFAELDLGQVWDRYVEDSKSLGIMTAFSDERSHDENLRKSKALAAGVRRAGFGYLWIDVSRMEPDKFGTEESEEVFLLVTDTNSDKLKACLLRLAEEHDLESLAFKRPGDAAEIEILKPSGKALATFHNPDSEILPMVLEKLREPFPIRIESARAAKGWSARLILKGKEEQEYRRFCI